MPGLPRGPNAVSAHEDPTTTLDDLREAVTSLVETERTTRRVLGGAHPLTSAIEDNLQHARATLFVRETQPPGTAYCGKGIPVFLLLVF